MTRRRVLVVEDDAVIRKAMQKLLERSGYIYAGTGNGTQGLPLAERLHPDVILLDIRMPGLYSYEVCRRLKENPATAAIPVIFLTAVHETSLERLAFDAGAVACITKP
ncbi:MAG TPA: response regulator, partial [Candidatus Methylomirabilis sp.]|nr:response regulator [Candidatus Methylomirabilis sp.]